jgi:hypothetical protein
MTSFEPTSPPPRTWDFLLTIVFIIIEAVLVAVLAIGAFTFSLDNLGCETATSCDPTRVQVGQILATWAPAGVALTTAIVAIVRVLRRKIAFWIPLLGIGIMVGVFLIGRVISTF